METVTCTICTNPIPGRKTLSEYEGRQIWLCEACAVLPATARTKLLKGKLPKLPSADVQPPAPGPEYRKDIKEEQVESLLLHAFLDLIQERKAAGKRELAATMETIATWLSDRTTLPVRPYHVQILTLALRDGLIISVGGGGIGKPNTYDTREGEMGLEAFWDQVDAFLTVWRMPNRKSLLEVKG